MEKSELIDKIHGNANIKYMRDYDIHDCGLNVRADFYYREFSNLTEKNPISFNDQKEHSVLYNYYV